MPSPGVSATSADLPAVYHDMNDRGADFGIVEFGVATPRRHGTIPMDGVIGHMVKPCGDVLLPGGLVAAVG